MMMRIWKIAPMLALLSAAPLPSDDAGVVRAAPMRVGTGEGRLRCVTPTLVGQPFEDMRGTIGESPEILAGTPQARNARVRRWAAQDIWYAADDTPLTGPRLDEVLVAVVAILLADPFPPPPHRFEAVGELNGTDGDGAAPLPEPESEPEPEPDGPAITPDLLQPGQQLREAPGCLSITLSNVARRGEMAFIDIGIVGGPLSGSGEQWAFRRDGTGWRWIAGHRTWIS